MNAPVLAPEAATLIVERDFDAPRDLVWAAFTRPDMLSQWWGPVPHPAVSIDMDVRQGGPWRNCLRSIENGEDLWQDGVFTEVAPPERLVFTFAWEEAGERGDETIVTITFTEQGGKTRLTLTQTAFASAPQRDGHGFGWNSSFDRLTAFLTRE